MNQFLVRQRNITFSWRLDNRQGEPFSLSGYDYRLVYYTGRGTSGPITTTLTGEHHNVLNWTMTREEQIQAGVYSLKLVIFFDNTLYTIVRYQDAFMLVETAETRNPHTWTQENEEQEPFSVTLFSTVGAGDSDTQSIAHEVDELVSARIRAQRYMVINQSLGGNLSWRDSETVTCNIVNGYGEDVTQLYVRWYVTRDSGDEASDAVWNALHTNTGRQFTIAFDDLNIDFVNRTSNLFTVWAVPGTGNPLSAEMEYTF